MILAGALDAMQPLRVPGFAFPWLELISHRCASPTQRPTSGFSQSPHSRLDAAC